MDCLKALGNLDSTSFWTAQAKGAGKRSLQRRREERRNQKRFWLKTSPLRPLADRSCSRQQQRLKLTRLVLLVLTVHRKRHELIRRSLLLDCWWVKKSKENTTHSEIPDYSRSVLDKIKPGRKNLSLHSTKYICVSVLNRPPANFPTGEQQKRK